MGCLAAVSFRVRQEVAEYRKTLELRKNVVIKAGWRTVANLQIFVGLLGFQELLQVICSVEADSVRKFNRVAKRLLCEAIKHKIVAIYKRLISVFGANFSRD